MGQHHFEMGQDLGVPKWCSTISKWAPHFGIPKQCSTILKWGRFQNGAQHIYIRDVMVALTVMVSDELDAAW